MIRYIHGSADSTDLDVMYVFDALPSSTKECHLFCSADPNENRNIIVIKDGIVEQCFKGKRDEVNNAILFTYSLHEQEHPLLITRSVERDVFLKDISITRNIMSPLTRSHLRRQMKEALHADWPGRMAAARELDLRTIDFDHVGNWDRGDLLKSMAFKLGQGIGLHRGTELYTKAAIAEYLPRLRPYLYRCSEDQDALQSAWEEYLQLLSQTETITLEDGSTELPATGAVYDIFTEQRLS